MRPHRRADRGPLVRPRRVLASSVVLILASAEGVAGITAGATLLAASGLAFVTLYANNRRLTAEGKRQAAALVHDRELVDLADLRTLLDQAAIALDHAGRVREEVEVAFASQGFAMPKEMKEALGEEFGKLVELNSRLSLRLGVEDPVAVQFEEANDALWHILGCLDATEGDPAEAVRVSREKVRQYGAKSSGHAGSFVTAAVKRAGAVQMNVEGGEEAAEAERRAELIAEAVRLSSPLR